jgi:acyl dehydratase
LPIDRAKLLAFPIPEGRQELTGRGMALYALSIGIGHDPLDRASLVYLDPLRGPAPMPAMVLVMAHPGFWMGHPDSGIDPRAVLHGTQRYDILAELPRGGVVTSRSRVTGLVDKGPSKAALILTETNLFDENGLLFARLLRNTFVRGGGGFGGDWGMSPPSLPPAPVGEPDIFIDLPTRPEQALLYRLNGDLNPLHSDPDVARAAGFERPILHGLCVMGAIGWALMRGAGVDADASLPSMALRFVHPVRPGETIRTEIWRAGQFRASVPERGCVVADQGQFAVTGTVACDSGEN